MTSDPTRFVTIATCANPAEAAVVRAALGARGIVVHISGENHASMLGPMLSGFISLAVQVPILDAEAATAIIAGLRDGEEPGDGEELGEEWEAADHEVDGDATAAADPGDLATELETSESVARIERRRTIGVALLAGTFITFGAAHLSTQAWFRGISLAAVELVGIRHLLAGDVTLGAVLVAGAIVADVVGAVCRIVGQTRFDLPGATLLDRRRGATRNTET